MTFGFYLFKLTIQVRSTMGNFFCLYLFELKIWAEPMVGKFIRLFMKLVSVTLSVCCFGGNLGGFS